MPTLVKLDLGDTTSNKDLENGTYEARIEKVEGPTKGPSGMHYLKTLFVITDERASGRQVYYITMIEGEAANMSADLWNKATGAEVDSDEEESAEIDIEQLIGAEVRIVVKMKEYEGSMNPEVKKVLVA